MNLSELNKGNEIKKEIADLKNIINSISTILNSSEKINISVNSGEKNIIILNRWSPIKETNKTFLENYKSNIELNIDELQKIFDEI